jgi:hypothetical protein
MRTSEHAALGHVTVPEKICDDMLLSLNNESCLLHVRMVFLLVGIILILFSQGSPLEAQLSSSDTPPAQEILPLLYPNGVYDVGCQCLLWPPAGQKLTTWPDLFGPFLQDGETLAIRLKAAYPFVQGGARKYFLITNILPAQQEYTCHVCVPIVGGAVVTQSGEHWRPEAVSPGIAMMGQFGTGPQPALLAIGPDQYGVVLDEWSGNQGCFNQEFTLVIPIAGKLDVIGRFEGGRMHSGCAVPDDDIEAQYAALAQPDTAYFPITITKRTLREGRLLQEQIDTYQFSDTRYTRISSSIHHQIEAQGMDLSAITVTPATPMPTPTIFITDAGQTEALTLPAGILIDTSSAAYTVFMSLPQNLPEDELNTIKTRVTKQVGIQLLAWEAFQASATQFIPDRIVNNDYPEANLVAGILEILRAYPRTPVGVTWNGGIAITNMDYQYADKMYQTYQADPDDYQRARKKDPKADPVNPENHFNALIAPKN